MRQRYIQHQPSEDLCSLGEKIIALKALPVRTDFHPMQSWPVDKVPSKKLQEQFAIQVNKSMSMHAQSVMQDGYYAFADIEHQLIAYFELAILVKAFGLGNCDAFCGYIIDYLFENDLNVPFTMLALNNYKHVCVVLGVAISEQEYIRRGKHLITDNIYKDVIILDLWNIKLPIQRPHQFQQAMRELFDREAGFCINHGIKATEHEFSVRCLFHLPKPQVHREFYQRNFPIFQDLKKFYEKKINAFRQQLTLSPHVFFQSPTPRHKALEEDPSCCSVLINSVMNLFKSY